MNGLFWTEIKSCWKLYPSRIGKFKVLKLEKKKWLQMREGVLFFPL